MERKTGKNIEEIIICQKKPKLSHENLDLFDMISDDIAISILIKLCATARSPSDFISILLTCRRLNRLGLQDAVLKEAGMYTVDVRVKNWRNQRAIKFLIQCFLAGSNEAAYYFGMTRFYCFKDRNNGIALLTRAARKDHVPSIYSLAIIKSNSSGIIKNHDDLKAACMCWELASKLGHIDSLDDLAYCYMFDYDVHKNFSKGYRLMTQANELELACAIRASPQKYLNYHPDFKDLMSLKTVPSANPGLGYLSWTDSGFKLSPREKLPVNRFLLEWFDMNESGRNEGLRLCCDKNCGRIETRVNEFRVCDGCENARYCSRACQLRDYKASHKRECPPMCMLVHYDVEHNP